LTAGFLHRDDVTPIVKEGTVRGVCPRTGTKKAQCKCRPCINTRNQRSGKTKQRQARKALEVVTGKQTARYSSLTSNEESWGQPVRVEVKSGAQADPVATRFLASEKQSGQSKRIGDPRPFIAVFMPQQWGSDGIVCCRLSELGKVVEALVNAT
jgi:hypothetical protein